MPDDAMEANGGEASDAVSDNEHDYDEDDYQHKDDDDKMADTQASDPAGENQGEVKKKYDPKDPLRPRRKKARRACYACQRAHLTCGDERPCQRCVKRGLAEQCQDGVRKKAKYLHDAPPEALRPVLGPTYNPNVAAPSRPSNGNRQPSTASDVSSQGNYFASASQGYPVFSTGGQTPVGMPDALSFASQASPVSPTFQSPTATRPQPLGALPLAQVSAELGNYPTAPFYAPANPSLFDFDPESFNFGSNYGALEFGLLGQMASGAAETPQDPSSASQQGAGSDLGFAGGAVFGNGTAQYPQAFDNTLVPDFVGIDQNGSGLFGQGNLQHGLPHAYAIPGPTNLASPSTDNTASPQPSSFAFDGSPTNAANYSTAGAASGLQSQRVATQHRTAGNAQPGKLGPQSILGKRQRDPSYIYDSTKEPYAYRTSFHRLIAFLKSRFSPNKTLRIAKSLASIRPSFISCTMTLNTRDLIFMEKSFQRTLFEYEEFMLHSSSPTIVCRRTGEVAAVNKEFTALTGWTKDVLLGRAPNLNVNTGQQASSSATGTERSGPVTPQLKGMAEETKDSSSTGAQPVFVVELMDDDSVVEFYEDFAQLAFNDSRGRVTRKCRLLKYRPREPDVAGGVENDTQIQQQQQRPSTSSSRDPRGSILSHRVTRIDGEHGISKIAKDGKVDCTYTWTIKRDIFEIPMLIVMNFLPCYYRNQEPHQLAV